MQDFRKTLKWWQTAVVYQIYPRSFQDTDNDGLGDLRGIIKRLDYLDKLGVDAIWISPIYPSPNVDNGYDIVDYRDIDPQFGTMQDFEELLDKAHAKSIRIIMDLVVNHSSDQHDFFIKAFEDPESKEHSFYHFHKGFRDEDGQAIAPPNKWGAVFGGSAWEYVKDLDLYYLHSFAIEQPDLNWENPDLREQVYEMMRYWCDKGVDGFRMDVINLIAKPDPIPMEKPDGTYTGLDFANSDKVHTYLQEMNREVLSKYDLLTVGETGGVRPEDAYKYANKDGTELSMIFQFEHVDELDKDGPKGRYYPYEVHLTDLKDIFTRWQEGLEGKAWNSLFWCNHDQPRIVSRFGNDDEEYREKSAKMLAHVLHFQKGTPYIYQGEELAMTNMPFRSKAELRDISALNAIKNEKEYSEEVVFGEVLRTGRDNARTPMQWDDSKNAGFSGADETWIRVNPNYKYINAKEQLRRQDSVYYYYQALIKLRHEQELITTGKYELFDAKDPHTYSYCRYTDEEALFVTSNFTKYKQKVIIPSEFRNKQGEVWLTNDESLKDIDMLEAKLELPAYAALAFHIKK